MIDPDEPDAADIRVAESAPPFTPEQAAFLKTAFRPAVDRIVKARRAQRGEKSKGAAA